MGGVCDILTTGKVCDTCVRGPEEGEIEAGHCRVTSGHGGGVGVGKGSSVSSHPVTVAFRK